VVSNNFDAGDVRLNVDVDVAMTVLANGCYRWLATRLHGFDTAKPKQLYHKCVATGGQLTVHADRLVVLFNKRAHNPILREATLDNGEPTYSVVVQSPSGLRVPLPLSIVSEFPAAKIGGQLSDRIIPRAQVHDPPWAIAHAPR
jgi:hypothetical protein